MPVCEIAAKYVIPSTSFSVDYSTISPLVITLSNAAPTLAPAPVCWGEVNNEGANTHGIAVDPMTGERKGQQRTNNLHLKFLSC